MQKPASSLTRRDVLRALVAACAAVPADAAVAQTADRPPKLPGGAAAQFVELHPAKVMPTLKLFRLSGKPVDLAPTPGRVMLVNFWATWCDACGKELSSLQDLQKSFGASLEIVAIAHEGGGAPIVRPFLQKEGIKALDVYLDPDGVATAVATATQREGPFVLHGTPTSYIINPRGRIAGYVASSVDWKSEEAHALISYFLQAG